MPTTKVEFDSRGLTVIGELYLPAESAPDRRGAAIIISHPLGGVKEQTAALHATKFVEEGFIVLTFDAAYQGESEGEPRGLEDPGQRAEDVRSAVTYLAIQPSVDPDRIGALGICVSGGYVPFAAQTDIRIQVVATVSAADIGKVFREGIKDTAMTVGERDLEKIMISINQARIDEAVGERAPVVPIVPTDPEHIPPRTPAIFAQGAEYYRTPRAFHPRSINLIPLRSYGFILNFSAYAFNYMISPRPLLMIAGTEADTRYFSEEAIECAKEPKELFLVPGKTHVDLYDDLSVTFPKLLQFMVDHLTGELDFD